MRSTLPLSLDCAPEPAPASIDGTPERQPATVITPVPSLRRPHGPANGADRRTIQRLRRGQLPVDGRLDLHGLTQSEAHERLASFLAVKQRQGARCVLVITGRGPRNGGVLRQMTPRWLDEQPNRDRVLAHTWAQTRHGGEGALYILLRRRR